MVIRTADLTVMGTIANLTSDLDETATSMARKIQYFVNIILWASAIMGVAFLAELLGIGYNWLIAFISLVGIILSNVPEGLLVTVTVIIYLSSPFDCC